MNRATLILIGTLGSATLLIGAWMFQYLGYAPCKMCYWQRYPHMIAVAIGIVALATGCHRALAWIGAVAAAITGAVGAFHVGVEQKWWDGPSSCSGGSLGAITGNELLSTNITDRVVMCDEISWMFLSISMPGWNALFSFALVAVWIIAARRAT